MSGYNVDRFHWRVLTQLSAVKAVRYDYMFTEKGSYLKFSLLLAAVQAAS